MRRAFEVIGVLVLCYFAVLMFRIAVPNATNQAAARAAAVQLFNSIDLADSYADVLAAYWQSDDEIGETVDLFLNCDSSDEWRIYAGDIASMGVAVHVEFRDGKVSAVLVEEDYDTITNEKRSDEAGAQEPPPEGRE